MTVGGLAGAIAGPAVLEAMSVPVAASLVTAASAGATYEWSNWSDGRDVAKVSVGTPLDVKAAVEQYGPRGAVDSLARKLHRSIGTQLAEQSGIPYDDSALKLL